MIKPATANGITTHPILRYCKTARAALETAGFRTRIALKAIRNAETTESNAIIFDYPKLGVLYRFRPARGCWLGFIEYSENCPVFRVYFDWNHCIQERSGSQLRKRLYPFAETLAESLRGRRECPVYFETRTAKAGSRVVMLFIGGKAGAAIQPIQQFLSALGEAGNGISVTLNDGHQALTLTGGAGSFDHRRKG